jgi:hypothetical protein
MIKAVSYIEQLARDLSSAKPYFKQSPFEMSWKQCERSSFPLESGVYAILRHCPIQGEGYRYQGLQTKKPIVLYVGKATSASTIRERLGRHFANQEPTYQGSQFVKFLMQIIQDEEAVKRVLWSPQTVVATVPVPEGDLVIDAVERLAIKVLEPRFNIRDR